MKRSKFKRFLIFIGIACIVTGIWILARPYYQEVKQEKFAETKIAEFFAMYWGEEAAQMADGNNQTIPETAAKEAIAAAERQIAIAPAQRRQSNSFALFPQLLEEMKEYNMSIYLNGQQGLSDPWAFTDTAMDLGKYGLEDKPIAVLEIPKMNLSQPVYVGASMDHLELGVAQLAISSMPIGGINTNCVIAGHRGWRGALFFRHIEYLEPGDNVWLTNMWECMEYRVVEIRVINPHELHEIVIQEGRDLLTLITCHPYGSGGKYRYLVFCERVDEGSALSAAGSTG